MTAGKIVNIAQAVSTETPTAVTDTETTPVVPTPAPAVALVKAVASVSDTNGNGVDDAGDVINWALRVENTGNVDVTNVTIADALPGVTVSGAPLARLAAGASDATNFTARYAITQADVDAGRVTNQATVTGTANGRTVSDVSDVASVTGNTPTVSPLVQTPGMRVVKTSSLTTDRSTIGKGNAGDVITYAVSVTNTGNVTINNLIVRDRFEGGTATTLTCAPTSLAPGATATCQSYTHTITQAEVDAGGTLDNIASASGSTVLAAVSGSGNAATELDATPTVLRITKQAAPRDVRVGDMVRYTVRVENLSTVDAIDATLVDTPPAGFSFIAGSLQVADRDGLGRLVGTNPIRVDQLDIRAGESATVIYLLRVGAGVRGGVHVNSAFAQDGNVRSNTATAEVQLVGDPMIDETLVLGSVFDDRDGDRWQDPAHANGIRVKGGFAPDAYIAGSTTVDRGKGMQPEADASAPLLHGIALGDIAARQSDADPIESHRMVVRQKLTDLRLTDDFVVTTKQGLTYRMDVGGKVAVERGGDAAKGLNGAELTIQRRVAQVDGGYAVDYVITNVGVDERGIPGVRVASVEGIISETDQFGRYHITGIPGGSWERGRNFILKVDPATLPRGATFTTDNPLLRRITPGIPVRFDFGVKLPVTKVGGGKVDVEVELGEVVFDTGSARLRPGADVAIDGIAQQMRAHGGGEVVIAANGETEALAYDRARAVQTALGEKLGEAIRDVTISLRADVNDPASMAVGLDTGVLLGDVFFDTGKAAIKPQYRATIDKIAADIERMGGGIVGIVGHAEKRGSQEYDVDLAMRRATAVYEAIAAKLEPAVRAKLRVEISKEPKAPVGIKGQQGDE